MKHKFCRHQIIPTTLYMALLGHLLARKASSSLWRIVLGHDRPFMVFSLLIIFVSIIVTTGDSAKFRFYKSHPNGAKKKVPFGANLIINCTTNDPRAIVSLYHKSFISDKYEVLTPDNKYVKRENDVFIINFGSTSAGSYQCHATNEDLETITWRDPSTEVQAAEGYIPKAKVSTSYKSLDVGENFNLSCTTDSINRVTWFRTIANNKHVSISRDRITTILDDRGEKISFLAIKNATIFDSGQYVCIATYSNINASGSATIEVFEPKSPKEEKIMGLEPPIGAVRAPSNVELNCAFSGYPLPTIRWYKQGTEIQGCFKKARKACTKSKYTIMIVKRKRLIRGILRISRTNYNDHGFYVCAAFNKNGNASVSIFVNIETAARVLVDSSDQVVTTELGKTVNITCHAIGQPEPTVSWIKNKNQIILNKRKRKASLILKSVTLEDLGNYTCNATNFKSDIKLFTIKEQIKNGKALLMPQKGFTTTQLVIVIVVCVSVMFVILTVICIILYRRQKAAKYNYNLSLDKMADYQFDPDRTLLEQCRNLPYDPDWEFPEGRLVLGEILGSGAFGIVMQAEAIGIQALKPRNKSPEAARLRAKLHHSSVIKRKSKKQRCNSVTTSKQTVAVKTLKDGANINDYTDLASELKILMYIGEHENIINILGACTRGKSLMLIMEYAPHGNLLSFLREKRDIYEPNWIKTSNNPEQEFTLVDLAMAAYQISRGMEFLASRKCIHRDLAARNILVGYNYVMKISDFGLARDIYQDDLYVKNSRGLLPIKWMALESLFDRVYTHMSDVWSFGIVTWEIFTLGGTPYPSVPIEQLMDFLTEGQRMPQPSFCPDDIYDIMLLCWSHCPQDRPTFLELSRRFEQIFIENISEDSLGYLRLNSETVQYRNDFRPQEEESPTCEQATQNAAKCIPEVQTSTKAAPSSPTNNHNNNNNSNLYSTTVSKRPYHNEENPLLNHESAV